MDAVIGAEVLERRRRARARRARLIAWLVQSRAEEEAAVRPRLVGTYDAALPARPVDLVGRRPGAEGRLASPATAERRLREAIAAIEIGGRRPILALIAAGDRDAKIRALVRRILGGALGPGDWIARWHGDELIVVLHARLDGCLALIDRTCAPLGIPVGLALVHPGDTVTALVERARRGVARARARAGGAEVSAPT